MRIHAEIVASVLDEHVELFERAFVQQEVNPFARGKLALRVLRVDALLAAAGSGLGPPKVELSRMCRIGPPWDRGFA